MIWTEIKKAINSTLGTSEFKPLNEMISEMIVSQTGIKSIQRGSTTTAGNITIKSVNMDKAFVYSVSKGSAGYVSARGTVSSNFGYGRTSTKYTEIGFGNPDYYMSGSISGGSTDLTVKEFSAKLVNSTTLSCDGAVEWQVIEYN